MLLLLLLPVLLLPAASGFNLLAIRPASSASAPITCHATSPRLASIAETEPVMTTWPKNHAGILHDTFPFHTAGDRWVVPHVTRKNKDRPHEELNHKVTEVSRRSLLRGSIVWTAGLYSSGTIACASAYTVNKVEPNEIETYAEAQKGKGPLRILWVGAGDLKGVSKGLFSTGNEVIALDLNRPDTADLSAATKYATEHGYQLRFEKGDATDLKFQDENFDVVVSSMFLCQDFNPEVVVSEIRRVLKPGGRFGFYEHIEDIDEVIVGKVFGERSVIRVQHYPEMSNILAGVVKKV